MIPYPPQPPKKSTFRGALAPDQTWKDLASPEEGGADADQERLETPVPEAPIPGASYAPGTAGSGTAPAVPELRRKDEKERKGSGAVWGSGSGTGATTAFGVPARVGAGSGGGFLGSARLAAGISRFFGGSSTLLGSLFASGLGPQLVLGMMLAWGALLAYAGIRMLDLGSMVQPQSAGFSAPAPLEPSRIVIRQPRDRSLGYFAAANHGDLYGDSAPAEAAKDSAAPKEEKEAGSAPEVPKADEVKTAEPKPAAPKLDQAALLAKLTQDPGRLLSGGSVGAPSLKDALSAAGRGPGSGLAFGQLGASRQSPAMKRAMEALRAGRLDTRRGLSDRAMGQLKFANKMSNFGAGSSSDGKARQFSTDAFEQGQTIGGGLGAGVGDGIVVPPGDGAPGLSEGTPEATQVPPSQNVTPYQPAIDAAKSKSNNAAILYILGALLLALGMMLSILGYKLMSDPFTETTGAILLAMGIAMIVAGIGCIIGAAMMGNSAKNDGNNIKKNYGQNDQGQVTNECGQQGSMGVSSQSCNPSETTGDFNSQINGSSVQQDVAKERNSNYTQK